MLLADLFRHLIINESANKWNSRHDSRGFSGLPLGSLWFCTKRRIAWKNLLTSNQPRDSLWANLEYEEGRMQAYCMKCRKKVEIKNPKSITMKNKKPATQGVCPTCNTKVFKIGKA